MEFVNDQYAPLSHVPQMLEPRPDRTPNWVPDGDARRLMAYKVLQSYMQNTRRQLEGDSKELVNFDGAPVYRLRSPGVKAREYGDAMLLVDTARALVLGEDQSIEFPDKDDKEDRVWLREWARKERFTQKLLLGETLTIGLGDAVYVLHPSSEKTRPMLRVYSPDVLFLDTSPRDGWEDEDFPHTIHLGWEFEDDDGVKWLRRTTWTMHPLDALFPAEWGSRIDTCFYRVVDYRLDQRLENTTIYSPELTPESGMVVVQDWTDLMVDFIPVVHVPNTPSISAWGDSLLLRVGQLLDDLINTDTDLNVDAGVAASSALVTPDGEATGMDAGPGLHIGGSDAYWTDTSKNLDALTKYGDTLLERLAQNTRLAEALLGRVQPNEVPSGTALALGFHPARQLMRDLRTVRDEKFPLILRFAFRLAQAWGWAPAGETPYATVALGASLPSDQTTAVATVKDLLPIHAISTETAVQILADAGIPIVDAEEEVKQIRRESFEAAKALVDATNDVSAARKYLDLPEISSSLQAIIERTQ